jgi:predicted DNA-binding transcriptional regulator YafY
MDIRRKPDAEPHLVVFALDRIRQLELTDAKFKIPSDFNASEFFSECYGVVVGDGTPATTIRLRAFGRERYALQDLPIHHSQKLVNSGSNYTDFEVCLRPTADFKAYLASRGQWLIVMSPKWLAEEVVQIHREGIEKYQGVT